MWRVTGTRRVLTQGVWVKGRNKSNRILTKKKRKKKTRKAGGGSHVLVGVIGVG